jgi:uncharacterized membrane protein
MRCPSRNPSLDERGLRVLLWQLMKIRIPFILLLIVVVVSSLLRFLAASDNFWLDEVATYDLALSINSPMEAITRIRIDHHILNTMYMNLLGDHFHWGAYRLLSVISGVGAVVLMARVGSRFGKRQAFLAAILGGLSYPLINYSSEARGYAPAIFFSLAALTFLQEGWKRRILILRLLFWVSAILALLAHITSIYVLAGMSAWSLYRIIEAYRKDRNDAQKELVDAIITYLPPYMAILGIYCIMRQSDSMGGNIYPLSKVILETLAYLTGFGVTRPWLILGAFTTTAALLLALIHVYRKDLGRFIFYICTVLIAPVITLLVYSREYVYVRYFIVCFPFALLLIAELLDAMLADRKHLKATALAFLAVFLIGNGIHTTKFLKLGRGAYFHAVEMISAHADEQNISTVSGDHDFRVGMMVAYYARYFEAISPVRYIRASQMPEEGTDWYISHQLIAGSPTLDFIDIGHSQYIKKAIFPFYGLSGMQWTLYRNSDQNSH